jgi:hypothetical protein
MTTTESKLSLDPDGIDFVLRRTMPDGTTTTINLSETDILTLAQSAQALQLQILKRHDPKGENHLAVAVTEVAQIALHDESWGEAVLMTLIAQSGNRLTYALPRQIVELLVQRLPVFLARIVSAKPTKQ